MSGEAHVFTLPGKLSTNQAQGIANKLMSLPEVEYAEPDSILTAIRNEPTDISPAIDVRPLALSPNDPQYTNQWHYYETWGINAPAAWDITTGSASIVVADIDTGITNHAEFVGRTVPGYDFISSSTVGNDGNGRDSDPSDPGDWVTSNECGNGNAPEDSSWHGTHTAGTIGAAGNNSLGVTGVNWTSKILPVRVLGKCGGFLSDIADGMAWSAGLTVAGIPANTNPAKVMNLSLGGRGVCSTTMQNTINTIIAAGSVIVVAAGNDTIDASGATPANCNGVITVASTTRTGYKASYSNYGASVEISAPGGAQSFINDPNGVLSTFNTGTTSPVADSYVYDQGTSMAAPHVTGVVSLMFSINPALTPAQVLAILQSTAKTFPVGGTCTTSNCGSGIIDAGAAVATVAGLPIPTATITQTPTVTQTQTPGCNLNAIGINDAGTASPYPSSITLSGLGTSITDVNVQLLGFTHTWPDDTDVLLVGPQGQNLLIMSDAGGGNPGVSNINLTLDDSAASDLPYGSAVSSGTYRPSNFEGIEDLTAPAPTSSGATTLATFNGTNPNGTWSLYIVDDTGGDYGSLAGGWCLNVSTSATATPTVTASSTQTNTATPMPTTTFTATPAVTSTVTPTISATPTASEIVTSTTTKTFTPTITHTSTVTLTPVITSTLTATATQTFTATVTQASTHTETVTPAQTASITPTVTPTRTGSITFTATVTRTLTPTITPSITNTGTRTQTFTPTVTATLNSLITVTLNQAAGQVDPTNTQLLSFTATFSEAVSGFTTADVNIALSDPCAPSVAITGSGTTYNIALTGMTKECTATVSIPAGVVNSVSHPGAVNAAATSTDNSQEFAYIVKKYYSGVNDGWVLETFAGSNHGGTMNSSDDTMNVGDDANNREYRLLTRFNINTDPIPANAVIPSINYRIKLAGISGTNPFGTHGNLLTELNTPYFGNSGNLELIDFQSLADKSVCNFETTLLADNAYRCVFFKVAIDLFPRNGAIDLRSRFTTGDTNNIADLLTIYTGNTSAMYLRPQLYVSYYLLP